MAKFNYEGITIRCDCKIIPLKGYTMTWFGQIWTRASKHTMLTYFSTERGKSTIRHEKIHILQHDSIGSGFWAWIWFYILYLWHWAKMFFRPGKSFFRNKVAYKTIPFEIEAYSNQDVIGYDMSEWKAYNWPCKKRIEYYEKTYGNI